MEKSKWRRFSFEIFSVFEQQRNFNPDCDFHDDDIVIYRTPLASIVKHNIEWKNPEKTIPGNVISLARMFLFIFCVFIVSAMRGREKDKHYSGKCN